MAIHADLSYRLGFYYPNRSQNQIYIQQDPLSRGQAIQAVIDRYDPNDQDTDVFVAVVPDPSDLDLYARDFPATEEAQEEVRNRQPVSEEESDDDTLSHASNRSSVTLSKTPPLPDSPAVQAALFFPAQANESESQRQERTDAATLFAAYPLTAQNFWSRFHKPTVVESTMFDIWETGTHATQGPQATKDMVRANIARMKDAQKVYELQALEELFDGDS